MYIATYFQPKIINFSNIPEDLRTQYKCILQKSKVYNFKGQYLIFWKLLL